MYISGQRETGRRRSGEIKIPESYGGNAFSENALFDVNENAVANADALRTAEEAFRRGYVFEETKPPDRDEPAAAASEPDTDENAVPTFADDARDAVTVHRSVKPQPSQRRGGLSGILDVLTSENIILIALILVLWDSKADDELLLMLVILFLC